MGACHAIRVRDYDMAADFCCEASRYSKDIFADRLITLNILTHQGKPIKEILLHIGTTSNNPSLEIKAYRMLVGLENDPSYYSKIIRYYINIDKPQKALQWSHDMLSLLIEKAEWKQAEELTLGLLDATSNKVSLYEQLENIYTHWNNHKLEDLWLKLGKAYVDNQQLAQAEKVYSQAFKQFGSFQHAVNLADIFIRQGEITQGVQLYYRASSIALLDGQLDGVRLCVTEIKKNDARMELLDLSQRMMLLTQSTMLELSNELKSTQQELLKLSDEIKVLKKISPVEASKNAPKPAFGFGQGPAHEFQSPSFAPFNASKLPPPSSFSFAPPQNSTSYHESMFDDQHPFNFLKPKFRSAKDAARAGYY